MKTLRNYLPLLWQVCACSENEVFYLVKTKKGLKWKDSFSIKCNKDFVVSKSLKKLRKILNKSPAPPSICERFEFNKGYPLVQEDIEISFWLSSDTYFYEKI